MTDRQGEFVRLSVERPGARTLWSLVTIVLALSASACGGDDDEEPEMELMDGPCPNLAGVWTITGHCALPAGAQVEITQDECVITTAGSWPGFTGFVSPDGSFTLRGTTNNAGVTCGGVATPKTITETCDQGCVITLKR
jgi:hypothetical protein